jgi:hypothetical protein
MRHAQKLEALTELALESACHSQLSFHCYVRKISECGLEFFFYNLACASGDGSLCGGLEFTNGCERGAAGLAGYDR